MSQIERERRRAPETHRGALSWQPESRDVAQTSTSKGRRSEETAEKVPQQTEPDICVRMCAPDGCQARPSVMSGFHRALDCLVVTSTIIHHYPLRGWSIALCRSEEKGVCSLVNSFCIKPGNQCFPFDWWSFARLLLAIAPSLLVQHTNLLESGRNRCQIRTTLILPDVVIPWRNWDISVRISPPRVSSLDQGCMCNATPPSGCPAESIQSSVWK